MRRVIHSAAALGFCAAVGCADVKPVVRTAVDVARDLCAVATAERNGISTTDAVKTFCATESQLEPWIEAILAAEKSAAAEAEAAAQ